MLTPQFILDLIGDEDITHSVILSSRGEVRIRVNDRDGDDPLTWTVYLYYFPEPAVEVATGTDLEYLCTIYNNLCADV